jgi:hypothetical protein
LPYLCGHESNVPPRFSRFLGLAVARFNRAVIFLSRLRLQFFEIAFAGLAIRAKKTKNEVARSPATMSVRSVWIQAFEG